MKTILVPIDFSEKSENALNYAIALNKEIHAEIVLLGSYDRLLFVLSSPMIDVPDIDLKEYVEEKVGKLANECKQRHPEMNFRSVTMDGVSWTSILNDERISESDLIVIGVDKSNPVTNFLTTGLSFNIIQKAILPVLTIPPGAKYSGFKKIVFAANYGVDDYKNVSDLISLAKIFGSEIILFHISDNNHEFDFNEFSTFAAHLSEESGFKNITTKIFEDRDIFHGLNSYLDESNADLLSISMRNRSFYSKLFHPGLTKKMVYHSHIPTMIFHTGY